MNHSATAAFKSSICKYSCVWHTPSLPAQQAANDSHAYEIHAWQMRGLVRELASGLGQLLKQRRAGVVAALVAAAHRTGACQEAVCKSLAAALTGGASDQVCCAAWRPPWRRSSAGRALVSCASRASCTGVWWCACKHRWQCLLQTGAEATAGVRLLRSANTALWTCCRHQSFMLLRAVASAVRTS